MIVAMIVAMIATIIVTIKIWWRINNCHDSFFQMLPWNKFIYDTKLGDWLEKAENPRPHANLVSPHQNSNSYGCCYGCSHGIAMIAAMGLLWLLLWDCYGWYHGIAMVAAMGKRIDNNNDGDGRAEW